MVMGLVAMLRMRRPLMLVAAAVLILAGNRQLGAQDHAGLYEQTDINYGLSLYRINCIGCHGEGGDAISGVNLRGGRFRNASSDGDLEDILSDGIPGTAMPPGEYSAPELGALVAYLRNMDVAELSGVALGDAGRGQALFESKGDCGRCHRVRGQGPRFAPDLSNIGAVRSPATLERKLLDPDGSMLPINRPVRVVTADGTVINGRRLNEDTFSIQLIDDREHLVSLDKAELREYTLLTTSRMPSYAETFTDEETADVLAYLLSLKRTN